jgi:hypothetical protein
MKGFDFSGYLAVTGAVAMRLAAVIILVALVVGVLCLCAYIFSVSLEYLNVFNAYASRSEVLPALTHLIASAFYLLLTMLVLLLIGILVYMLIVSLVEVKAVNTYILQNRLLSCCRVVAKYISLFPLCFCGDVGYD